MSVANISQEGATLNASAATSASVTLGSPVVLGDALHVGSSINNATTLNTPTDNLTNAYNLLDTFNDTTSGRRYAHFGAVNCAAGSTTVNASWNSSLTNGTCCVRDATFVQPSPSDGHNVANQQTPGTGTDGVTVSATNSLFPALMSVIGYVLASVGIDTAGTGFTFGANYVFGNTTINTESKRVTNATAQNATFTAAFNVAHTTFVWILDEFAGSAGAVVAWLT